jgi:cyclic pyranopterin phosphate synthase
MTCRKTAYKYHTEESDLLPPIKDTLDRPLKDLRISVLDRCNLRCTYCMPVESLHGRGVFLPSHHLLSDGEIELLVRVFTRLGVHKVRLTGGEPLLRPGFVELVSRISAIEGITDLALTTNGVLLPRYAAALKKAGLGRITGSLDSLDETIFRQMAGGRGTVAEVLDGIRAAEQAGFEHMKINTVVQRNINDHTVAGVVGHFRNSGHTVRLIEFMDVGNVNNWDRQMVVPSAELLRPCMTAGRCARLPGRRRLKPRAAMSSKMAPVKSDSSVRYPNHFVVTVRAHVSPPMAPSTVACFQRAGQNYAIEFATGWTRKS